MISKVDHTLNGVAPLEIFCTTDVMILFSLSHTEYLIPITPLHNRERCGMSTSYVRKTSHLMSYEPLRL